MQIFPIRNPVGNSMKRHDCIGARASQGFMEIYEISEKDSWRREDANDFVIADMVICLWREADAPHHCHKARVGAIAVPDGVNFEPDDGDLAIIDRLLQSRKRLLLLTQSRI